MEEILAYCGLYCHSCPIYLATREENDQLREKMRGEIAEQIKEHYGQEYRPEEITGCDGCRTESDRLFSGCSQCHIRKCARKKRVENCAYCDEYVCEKLEEIFQMEPDARKRLDEIKTRL